MPVFHLTFLEICRNGAAKRRRDLLWKRIIGSVEWVEQKTVLTGGLAPPQIPLRVLTCKPICTIFSDERTAPSLFGSVRRTVKEGRSRTRYSRFGAAILSTSSGRASGRARVWKAGSVSSATEMDSVVLVLSPNAARLPGAG
jgi:hypothetical protein